MPAAAFAGHGLERCSTTRASGIAPQAPRRRPSPRAAAARSGSSIATFPTGNPHTDLDFFTQRGETYGSVGTLGIGPNGGGQEILQLTDGGKVAPSAVNATRRRPA